MEREIFKKKTKIVLLFKYDYPFQESPIFSNSFFCSKRIHFKIKIPSTSPCVFNISDMDLKVKKPINVQVKVYIES